jgi:hypothetical protein
MTARAEADQLVRIAKVRLARIIFLFEPSQIYQQFFGCRFAGER